MTTRDIKRKVVERLAEDLDDDFFDDFDLEPFTTNSLKKKGVLVLHSQITEEHLDIANKLLEYHYDEEWNTPITLLINSPGGYTTVGWSIIDVMNYIRLPVHTVALGEVCSIAADIFINGDQRTLGEHSTVMIHPHSGGSVGTYHELIASTKGDIIEHQRRILHYLKNSRYNSEEAVVQAFFRNPGDLYLSPQEVIEHGLADSVSESAPHKRTRAGRDYTVPQPLLEGTTPIRDCQ